MALLDGKKDASELQREERTELAQVLDSINTLAREADDTRRVCKREKAVGSNMTTETCMTVAQRRAEREAIQNSVRRQLMW